MDHSVEAFWDRAVNKFVVSLLRGAAYEWYGHYETRTGCPGGWTTLHIAMLERFGSSIRAEKAQAGLR